MMNARFVGGLLLAALPSWAEPLTPQQIQQLNLEATSELTDFAFRMCGALPLEEKRVQTDMRVKAQAELAPVLKKLADIGVSVARNYTSETSTASLVNKDVLPALQDHTSCVVHIVDSLRASLLIEMPAPTRPARPTIRGSSSGETPVASRNLSVPDLRGLSFSENGVNKFEDRQNIQHCNGYVEWHQELGFGTAPLSQGLRGHLWVGQSSRRVYEPPPGDPREAPSVAAEKHRLCDEETPFVKLWEDSIEIVPTPTELRYRGHQLSHYSDVSDIKDGDPVSGFIEVIDDGHAVRIDRNHLLRLE